MSTTPNMSLVVPDVGTSGPTYATQINSALDVIDAHDHTPGKGARIPPSGLNINADLPFNGNDAISLRSTRYVAQTAVLAASDDRNCVSSVNGNLYWNNSNGVPVQITAGNGLNFASLGTIGGDYGAAGVTASAVYTDSLKTFSWLQAASTFAKMAVGDLALYSTTASTQAVSIKASASTAAYDYIFPITAPAANTFMRMALGGQGTFVTVNGTANQITVTQNTSDMTLSIPNNPVLPGDPSTAGTFTATTGFVGPGSVPVGTIIAIGDVGAWALPASGAIKEGWARCNGQAKPAGSAVGIAANLPDLTDDRFLNGSTAATGTGGATSKTTTGVAARVRKDSLNSGQIAHAHGMDHKHRWLETTDSGANQYNWYSYNSNQGTAALLYQSGQIGTSDPAYAPYVSDRIFWEPNAAENRYTQSPLAPTGTSAKTSSDSASISFSAYNAGDGNTYIDAIMTQGTISDIRPKYFNVVYVMRVA